MIDFNMLYNLYIELKIEGKNPSDTICLEI